MVRLLALVVSSAALGVATLASAASTSSPRLVPVVRGLDEPVAAVQAPGEPGRLYVVEQPGLIRVVDKGKLRAAPFLDVRGKVVAGGEQGLLGLAFPPDYRSTRTFYVNYTARGSGATTIARYRTRSRKVVAGSGRTLLTVPQPYANHNGGNLAFGPDGLLWVGLGDGGAGGDPENRAQRMSTLLGKLFTLDVRNARPTPVIRALGLRNPWRYSFDGPTGDLWIGDVGQNAIEEVDVLRKGTTELVNFGWDVYEGDASYESKPLGPGKLVGPVAQYPHAKGCSITGGAVFRGAGIPTLSGRYVFADYCSGTVWSMPAEGGASRVEPVKTEAPVSFGVGLDGTLYLVSHDGAIFRFAP